MATKKKVVIIGAGIGGLATANLLAKAGYDVHVYEKDATPGGRAGQLQKDGFTFDTGPSWYLMPDVFRHYYELLGESADDALDPIKLSPAYKVFFDHDAPLTITGDIAIDSQTFETIEPGAGAKLRQYVTESDEIYQMSLRHFLYSNFTHIGDLIHRDIIRRAWRLVRMSLTSIDRHVSRYVRDRRLRQVLEYPAVFLGVSPFQAPALYSMMSALDFKEGVFYPRRGIYSLIESMVAIGARLGVTYHYETPVVKIHTAAKRAVAIELADGTRVAADEVVANADIHFTETQLLEPADRTYDEAYWARKQPSPSAMLLYLGVKGAIPEFEHHNLLFIDDWEGNFQAIYETKTPPQRASMYVSKTSQTEVGVAPDGDEAVFVLVPLPAGIAYGSTQAEALADRYLAQIKDMTGVDLGARAVVREMFGPDDFRTKFHSWQSSMLGQSHVLAQSAFFRTPNTSRKLDNLLYVGGSTTPGVGLPMCLIGAELVYKRLAGERRGGRVAQVNPQLGVYD